MGQIYYSRSDIAWLNPGDDMKYPISEEEQLKRFEELTEHMEPSNYAGAMSNFRSPDIES